MKWIGLTGGIGSGKSSVTKLLRKHGIPVVDADALAREVVADKSPGLALVVENFGKEILNPDGGLDRKAMAALVFNQPERLAKLESILHPLIQKKVLAARMEYEASGVPFAVYDVPLLFEKNLRDQFDYTIVVWAPKDVQIARVMARDHLTREQVQDRMKNQIPLDEKKQKADYVIDNSCNEAALEMVVSSVVNKMTEKYSKR